MVIPKFARRNGIAVQLYVLSAAAIASLTFALATSYNAHALPPVSKIPIVGQPVANVVSGVTDGVVKPATESVTSILPQPVGNIVQAPVNAATRVIEPIVGTPSQASNARTSSQRVQPGIAASNLQNNTNPVEQSNGQDVAQANNPSSNSYSKLASSIGSLDKHTPVLGIATKSFATTKDPSTVIAMGIVLLVMSLLFVSLVAMIIRSNTRVVSSGEPTLLHRDLTQASAIVVGLIAVGSLTLYVILSS